MASNTPSDSLRPLANPLVTPLQLTHTSSSLDSIPIPLQSSIRYAAQRLTQAAGILLDLPQDVIAQAIVFFTRFWMGPEGGSLAVHSAKDISAAAIFLSAKTSFHPRSIRSILNVYTYLLSPTASPLDFVNPINYISARTTEPDSGRFYLTDDASYAESHTLKMSEMYLLRGLGFNLHVTLPYAVALTYLQTMNHLSTTRLTARVIAHLNTALLSPQLVYLTHQANALAVAAIYLSAREVGVKLVEGNWWEVFDVSREELGFLVVAMQSMDGFAKREKEMWIGRGQPVPLTVVQLEAYLKEEQTLERVKEGEYEEGEAQLVG